MGLYMVWYTSIYIARLSQKSPMHLCSSVYRYQSESNGMGLKTEAKFRTFHPPPSVEFRGGINEMSELIFPARSRTQPLIYF